MHDPLKPIQSIRRHRTLLGLVTVSIVTLTGCADVFRAHNDLVAHVEDSQLSVQRLAELLVLGQPLPLEVDIATELTNHWIDATAMALRIASGDSLWTENFVREAMWLNIRRLAIARWRDRAAEEGLTITPTAVDSAYRVGEHRLVAHILRAVPPNATTEFRQQQRARAQAIRDELLSGMTWEEANTFNEDSLTRNANGSLGVTGRGTFVPRFENVAYGLGPGDLSRVVETQAGYHLIFRPTLENAREPFTAFVAQALRARFDSTYNASLFEEYEIAVPDRTTAILRGVAETPFEQPNSRPVVTYTGGSVDGPRLAEYIRLLPPRTRTEMTTAPDSDLVRFVRGLAMEEILWHKADSAGFRPSDSTITLVTQNYRRDLVRLWNQMGLSPDSINLQSDGTTPNERAAVLVDRYFEAAVSRRIPLQTIPGFLSVKLRESVSWEIEPAGLAEAVDLAKRLQSGLDPPTTDGGS